MKIKLLGTAAAEGIPAMFCACEDCVKARKLGGRNIRSRSQAIINDKLLIDFPCDTFYHMLNNGIDLVDIQHCIITHNHHDHFYPKDLANIWQGSHPPKDWCLHIYGSEDVAELEEASRIKHEVFQYHYLEPFVPVQIEEFTVTPLKACHGTEHPYFYSIACEKQAILYAQDTDLFPEETWDYLKKTKQIFDIVILDCTECATEKMSYKGHMCLNTNVECCKRLQELDLIHENTKIVINHFSHNGTTSVYDDLKPLAEEKGFILSYDGIEIEAIGVN